MMLLRVAPDKSIDEGAAEVIAAVIERSAVKISEARRLSRT